MRILVTGSRDWDDARVITHALYGVWREARESKRLITLVHGACPTGADQLADEIWTNQAPEHAIERHPADWSKGRKAGPERNAEMVALGADLCLAFIGPCTSPRCKRTDRHDSHGATGCADLAEAAGIPTRRIPAAQPEVGGDVDGATGVAG